MWAHIIEFASHYVTRVVFCGTRPDHHRLLADESKANLIQCVK
jgi:hypothetical protein